MENMREKDRGYKVYLKALIGSGAMSLILLVIASLFFYFMQLSESQMNTAVWVITVLAICYSGIYGALKIGKKGYLHGAILGSMYTLLIGMIAFLTELGDINIKVFIITLITSMVIGSLSGMIGMMLRRDK